jgi:Fic family protein
MLWNWQQPDWPNFTWSTPRLAAAEEQFLLRGGVYLGNLEHLNEDYREQITVEGLCSEALTTSEIEGEILDRDSVQSSIRRQLGLKHDSRRAHAAEFGVAEMMVNLYRNHQDPLEQSTLFDWHNMLCNGRRDLHDVGRYRQHEEPMQVVSGRLDKPRVHFSAPPSSQVGQEMARFLEWFAETGPGGSTPLPGLTRSAIAHLYFVSIHPFEDGNGRIGRAIAEKALAQALGGPSLIALAATILTRRCSYYSMLEAANQSNEISNWLAWSAGITLEAQQRSQAQVTFSVEKVRFLERFRGLLNSRQEAVIQRTFQEGIKGFDGGLSAGNYAKIAKTSAATTTRDLGDLVRKGALRKQGARKSTRYSLAIPEFGLKRIVVNEAGALVVDETS